jgi:type I restriction enzyme R subunit
MSKIHHECELERHIVEQLAAAGWLLGESAGYDRARALYPQDVIGWLQDSQPQAWAKLQALNGAGAEAAVLDRLVKTLEAKEGGTVEVLRRGVAVAGGGVLAMSQPLPEDDCNPTVIARYKANRLRVVPQLAYSLDKADRIDLAFFINRLPVATVELKTDFTQSVAAAMAQYRDDRPPKSPTTGRLEPLLAYRRSHCTAWPKEPAGRPPWACRTCRHPLSEAAPGRRGWPGQCLGAGREPFGGRPRSGHCPDRRRR